MTDARELNTSSAYDRLIGGFALRQGIPAESVTKAQGLEFESDDGLVARVRAHPQDEERLIIEVDVITLTETSLQARAEAMLTLHQINYAARTEHDWTILIDDESMLMLSAAFWVVRIDERALETLLADSIDRAQALRRLWAELDAAHAAQTPPATDLAGLVPGANTMIRG